MASSEISKIVKQIFGANVTDSTRVGSGISGNVYKINIDASPYVMAVKTAENGELLERESKYINYIKEYADVKLPKIYYLYKSSALSCLFMEYFDGVAASSDSILSLPQSRRDRLAMEIADNIAQLQAVKGQRYGDLLSPQYDRWLDYYLPFATDIRSKAIILAEQDKVDVDIVEIIKTAFEHFDYIFDGEISAPTIIHGDYWASNIIVDSNAKLIGVVDPFNALWADSEYEMFGLNAVYGDKLPVLEAFLSKHNVSSKFALKNQFYLLFSETYWVTIMGHDNNDYLRSIGSKMLQLLGLAV